MGARISLKIRIYLDEDIAIGPGKADLLEAIHRCGSISAAARDLGMSYRRAWLLVETMNRCFREPLVLSLVGGRHGGGAKLSETGEQVLRHFRNVEAKAREAVEPDLAELRSFLADG